MNTNATDRTLGLVNIWQVLRKLRWEIYLVKSIPEALTAGKEAKDALHVQDAKIYALINAASTGLALVDWLLHTINNDSQIKSSAVKLFGSEAIATDKKLLLISTNPQ